MSRKIYSLLFYLLLPALLLRLLWRGLRAPDYRQRWGERFGYYSTSGRAVTLWIHCVSVGEFVAAIPLIRSCLTEGEVLVTTMTPTGSARVRAEFGDQLQHVYLPYDLPAAVSRFLRQFSPSMGVVMETELWPNLFHGCRSAEIPLLLANVRLSQRSYEGYQRWVPGLVSEALCAVTWAALQSEADAQRLAALGMAEDKISVTGSIKFDLTLPAEVGVQGVALRETLGVERPIWIAASTREGEEEAVLMAHRALLRQLPDALLVLVPRHPERFNRVARQVEAAPFHLSRRALGEPCEAGTEVYLADTMGEMMLLYSAVDIAYVGGSLVPTGAHNMLEPAALGKPVLFGPHRFNFAEISQLLINQGAALEVADAAMLTETLRTLFLHRERQQQMGQQGLRVVAQNRGALDKLLAGIRAQQRKKSAGVG
ncbi:MAG: 3-deoxy-D-manno-octulosonic acid transferase [Gammaproteobacteria bacterium]|jgi:3-deoxy-D-manno-octulosonic-acid transferase|nr:3-deoxy-D-manno-octulosonic acid transferase [Gammaproteobacteria bacterium]MBT7308701.1 3-deoxy-D-manno-octulosonic acid transferase [Gammaproteobacteria bacterium]